MLLHFVMPKDFEKYKKSFCVAFTLWFNDHYKGVKGAQKKCAEDLGISQSLVSAIINGHKWVGDEVRRREIAEIIGIKYDELIGIENHQPSQVCEDPPSYSKDPITLKHYRVVRQFPDSQTALEVNMDLLKIAKTDPNHFKELANYIKHEANRLEIMTPLKKDDPSG